MESLNQSGNYLILLNHDIIFLKNENYRISANSFRGNYSFLELGVRKLFKGGKYSREETIVFLWKDSDSIATG